MKDMECQDTYLEMSYHTQPRPYVLQGLTQQQQVWAERFNDNLRIIDSARMTVKGLDKKIRGRTDTTTLVRAEEKLKAQKKLWCDAVQDNELMVVAIESSKLDGAAAAVVMNEIKVKRAKKHKVVKDEWAAAEKRLVQEASKTNLLQQSAYGQGVRVTGGTAPWMMQGQVQPMAPQQWPMGQQQWPMGQQQWPMPPPPPPMPTPMPHLGRGLGKGEGKGKGKGKGGRNKPLDSPQRSRCPYLRGPFAPENERFDNPNNCSHCEGMGIIAKHSGSWECDLQHWTPRSKFNRGEIDRMGHPLAGGAAMPGLQQLGQRALPPPPPQP